MDISYENTVRKKPVLIDGDHISNLERVPLTQKIFQESWMQSLLNARPELLPVSEIDPKYAPLISIGREIPNAAGFIDNLYISARGYVTLVETKLWRNPEARRKVIGQIIDYAKELQNWDYEILNQFFEKKNHISIFDYFVKEKILKRENEAVFVDSVNKNLELARFLLLIVGDGIRKSVQELADFLNFNPTMQFDLGLVELEVYKMNAKYLVIPHLLTKTTNIERGVIRIENHTKSKITLEMQTQSEDDEGRHLVVGAGNVLSFDQFIKEFAINNKVSESELEALFSEVTDLGYKVESATAECGIKFTFNNWKNKNSLIRLYTNGNVYIEPNSILCFLERFHYSKKIGEEFLEEIRPFLTGRNMNGQYEAYEELKAFYLLRVDEIFRRKDDFVLILADFINKF
ncbi:hypothetical protein lbkm_3634 [Lachnospiraceae bacterium KM106-2]|nr:hypothetical protein lbkm_3634 [Lachnospiraceae bacterium KM106-2]